MSGLRIVQHVLISDAQSLLPQPPCKVETKTMLSPLWTSYLSSPSNSQSASFIRTSTPGRLSKSACERQ